MRIYSNPLFYRHHTGEGHPETPDRLDSAFEGVRRAGASHLLLENSPESADADRIIAKVHLPEYVRQFEDACHEGYRFFHTYDNPLSPDSFAAARECVATALTATEDIWIRSTHEKAFVIARPPGHHAERDAALGFCFFNTIACVAERILELEGIDRVFILDWDVHHGNGTQSIFEERDDVFYASIHRFPFFPGTGAENEIGRGVGRDCTRNIPLSVGAGDREYMSTFESVFLPLIDDYRPDAILLSAGFDAHVMDPIGGMHVTARAFGAMTDLVVDAARRHCGGRLLSLLEGGYDPEGLASCVSAHIKALGIEE